MVIQNEADYQAALQRREDLAGCLEDTPEEREMIAVQLAIDVWETRMRMG